MREDQKNLFLAMGLSLLVIVAWQYFYAGPKQERAREIAAQTQAAAPGAPTPAPAPAAQTPGAAPAAPAGAPSTAPAAATPETALTREAALAASPRIRIDTPALKGSISLKGGRIDDVALKGYRETVKPDSPNIVLLSPANAPQPFYADTGFVGQPGANVALPKADTLWSADSDVLTPAKPVTLTHDNGQGLVFTRKISVDDRYMFTVTDGVRNATAAEVSLYPYALVARRGKPKTDGYAVLHEGFVGIVGESRVQEFTYDTIEKEAKATHLSEGVGGWVGFTDKYWASVVIPDQARNFKGRFSSTGDGVKSYQSDALLDALTIAPGASAQTQTLVFAGAKETRAIDDYQKALNIKNFDLMIDWGWFYFITKPMFKLLELFFHLFNNFGLAILAVTVIVKAIFFPLANKSYVSMAKMKALQPQIAALRERHGDDKMKQQQDMMELYKREKINPLAGCLPILIQIPVFFSLYKVLFVTIEMRHSPFYGWIHDLSAPDPSTLFNLFGLIPWTPPHFLMLGVWPIIMGFTMFVQMKMNPEPPDPVQKMMFAWMPLVFTFMLASFPAGLVIYWSWNNLLSVLQQYAILKRQGVKVELWDNLRSMAGKPPKASN
jgi:YidC/Oxa1 family membrane protein insertase